MPKANSQIKNRFINRELSWLAFNDRVLEEAENINNPLLERVNFLSISATNLDEFTMVRVAGFLDHIRENSNIVSDDGLSVKEQISVINLKTNEIINRQQQIWNNIHQELKENKINIIKPEKLLPQEQKWLKKFFKANIFTVLTPIAIDPAHPFPFLPNLGIAKIFLLKRGKNNQQFAVLPLPQKLPRFIQLPLLNNEKRLITLEDVISLNWQELFPRSEMKASTLIRILRDSDLDIEDEAEDLVRHFERAVKERKKGRIIRIRTLSSTPPELLKFIYSQMQVEPDSVFQANGIIGLASLKEIYELDEPNLKFSPYTPRFPERIIDYHGDYFTAIEAKDMVVHHPFESFDVVVEFIRQAARDKSVISIKQTLYRTSADSSIVKALIEAAESGKSVTAVVELKARFDEEANIKWAKDLEKAGAQVVFGFVNLKTHCKIALVTRRIDGKLKSYVHFGTGNYHPNTAKVYTDLSFFTCDEAICSDVAKVFNFLTGYAPPKSLKKLTIAPKNMRNKLIELINNEIAMAKSGKPAFIWAKMNALVDTQIINALYSASQNGVIIELVVRGICCLRPQVSGLSDNIKVKSIVGRFLEHSRIYCFGNGTALPSPNAKIFIASADWMPRNFDWRVEAMLEVENATVHSQIMGQIMQTNILDEKNSWLLQADGNYIHSAKGKFSAHEYFMQNPSLSGRGKAIGKPASLLGGIYQITN